MENLPSPKLPPLPNSPPKKVIKSQICILCKKDLPSEIYTCKCGAQMCYDCALKRKYDSKQRLCPVCQSILFVKEK